VNNKRNLLLAWMLLNSLPNNSKFLTHFEKKKKERREYQFKQGSSEALNNNETTKGGIKVCG
jgi:hypothetical protein